ncbi:winged helix-turn-helix domain-containing protein [Bacillus smithii]|uniref:winged helix-turn-helix domain-containing protein n=1 Tax=Bacillus smithii TaxID=1479 RepID=UPI003D258DC6
MNSEKEYHEILKKEYAGTVTTLERYINPRAVILHHCSQCEQEFYAKPMWLVGKDSQRHVCNMPYGDNNGVRIPYVYSKVSHNKRTRRTLSESVKKQIVELGKQGISIKQIAKQLNIADGSVSYHLKKAGLG